MNAAPADPLRPRRLSRRRPRGAVSPRAAAQLGVSQSALSHTIRGLEERLGIRLLTRTTRAVAPTEAGERLLSTIGPRLDEIDSELAAVTALRDKPAGTIRITTGEHAATNILWPKLREILPGYPDITVEVIVDYGLTRHRRRTLRRRHPPRRASGQGHDRRAHRPGTAADRRGIASLFRQPPGAAHPARTSSPTAASTPRLPTYGGLYAWEFEKDGRELKVRVEGQLVFNSPPQGLQAALDGFGLAFVMEDTARHLVDAGRLIEVLGDWCPPFSGYHIYYPSRRQASPALGVLVDALRYRGWGGNNQPLIATWLTNPYPCAGILRAVEGWLPSRFGSHRIFDGEVPLLRSPLGRAGVVGAARRLLGAQFRRRTGAHHGAQGRRFRDPPAVQDGRRGHRRVLFPGGGELERGEGRQHSLRLYQGHRGRRPGWTSASPTTSPARGRPACCAAPTISGTTAVPAPSRPPGISRTCRAIRAPCRRCWTSSGRPPRPPAPSVRPAATLHADMQAFLDTVEAYYGKRPVIYTTIDFFEDRLADGAFSNYPLWVRSTAAEPHERYGSRPWHFWQYTSTGRVAGINGKADRNVFKTARKPPSSNSSPTATSRRPWWPSGEDSSRGGTDALYFPRAPSGPRSSACARMTIYVYVFII